MPKLLEYVRVNESTKLLVKAIASEQGIRMDEVIHIAVARYDRDMGGTGHKALVAEAAEIRRRVDERQGRLARRAAAAAGGQADASGRVYKHPRGAAGHRHNWPFDKLAVGETMRFEGHLKWGGRAHANRYRSAHPGWDFKIKGDSAGATLTCTAIPS